MKSIFRMFLLSNHFPKLSKILLLLACTLQISSGDTVSKHSAQVVIRGDEELHVKVGLRETIIYRVNRDVNQLSLSIRLRGGKLVVVDRETKGCSSISLLKKKAGINPQEEWKAIIIDGESYIQIGWVSREGEKESISYRVKGRIDVGRWSGGNYKTHSRGGSVREL